MAKGSFVSLALFGLLLGACGGESNSDTNAQPQPQPQPEGESGGTAEAPPTPTPPAQRPAAQTAELPDSLPNGLLLSYSQFPVTNGQVGAQPGAALVEILTRSGGEWHVDTIEDPSSNVFHKAMVYDPPDGEPGILTLSGTGAAVKLWRHDATGWHAESLWQATFGGNFDRMREAEVADLYGDQRPVIAVATHDQGVVEIIRPRQGDGYDTIEIDREANTFVHEIEIGDLNGDGHLEVYATPSEPNDLNGGEQHGRVVRYVPRDNQGRTVVADLGNRHAKEIWVGDVDGDGRDELYVAVEALTRGQGANIEIAEPVEIRRYDADTPADGGVVIARIPNERLCRFLTAGDVDGDGRREMVAASFSQGLWLLRPGRDPRGEWSIESVDRNSRGFEHAAMMIDLDENGVDELYVAADEQGELRRYVWVNGRPRREVIHRRDVPRSRMTWNILPVPASLVR